MLLPNLVLRSGEVKHIKVRKSAKEYDIWEGEYLLHSPCIIKELRTIPSGKKALQVRLIFNERGKVLTRISAVSCRAREVAQPKYG